MLLSLGAFDVQADAITMFSGPAVYTKIPGGERQGQLKRGIGAFGY